MTRGSVNYRRALAIFSCALVFASAPARAEQATRAEQSAQTVLSLAETAKTLGAELFWDPLSLAATVSCNGHLVNCRVGERLVLFDYRELALLDAPFITPSGIGITPAFADRLTAYFNALPPPVSYRVGAILVDPGHGGKDPGASGLAKIGGKSVKVIEKDIVLKVAKDLCDRLVRSYPDKKVLMTRTGDTYPSLEARVDLANSVKLAEHEAILYISIHANSAFNASSSGFEVWYLSPEYRRTVIEGSEESSEILPILNSMMEEEFTTESILIAKTVMDGIAGQIGSKSRNRGLKDEPWFVVRNARMPSVLIELGFVSNPEEAALLADDEYLKKCSLGIYNGLSTFITHFEGSRGFTSIQ